MGWLLLEAKKLFKKNPSLEGASRIAFVANSLRSALEVQVIEQLPDGNYDALQGLAKRQKLEKIREMKECLTELEKQIEEGEDDYGKSIT